MKISKLLKAIFLIAFFVCLSTQAEAQSLTDYANQRKQEIAEMQRVEKSKYEEACKIGTKEVFTEYLKRYPEGRYVIDINNRIADYDLWTKAKKANTIIAYNSYLQNSKFKVYSPEVKEAIIELQSVDKWNNIRQSNSINEVERFIAEFPKSSMKSNAQKRIHELKGIDYYKSGNLLSAYNEFNKAGGKYSVASENKSYFDESEEFYEYKQLNENSMEFSLKSFLDKYPQSKYYDNVSNMVAISKAKEFTMYSGESTFNSALSYAKDEFTRKRVEMSIKSRKEEYSIYKKNKRWAKRNRNGGLFLFGFEPLDFGWNGISTESDDYFDIYYYNMGFSVKLGNYKDPLQLEVGIKPGLLIIDDGYNDTETKFHMPAYARLKLNLFNMDDSKVYISGLGYYNIVREKLIENEFSVGGGFGIAWLNWDWHMLYYKQDLETTNGLKNQMLGTSFIYYF